MNDPITPTRLREASKQLYWVKHDAEDDKALNEASDLLEAIASALEIDHSQSLESLIHRSNENSKNLLEVFTRLNTMSRLIQQTQSMHWLQQDHTPPEEPSMDQLTYQLSRQFMFGTMKARAAKEAATTIRQMIELNAK